MTALVTFEQLGTDLEGLLAADSDLAVQTGAGSLQVLDSGAASEGDRIGGFVSLDPESCVLALARATSRVEDLDILAFDDAGTNLVSDQSVGPKASVMICPPHPTRVYLAARVASGSGLVAIGVQDVPRARSAAVASRLGARMSGLADDGAMREAWTGLDARVDAHRRVLGGKWEEMRRVSVPVSQRAPSYLSMPLGAARCLDLYALPNDEVRNLDVTVTDETGREIVRAASLGDDRFALVCTPVDVTLTIAVRPHQGFGLAAVVLSRSAPGSETELAVRPDARRVATMDTLAQVRARLGDSLSSLGYDKPRVVAEGTIDTGRTLSYPITLPAGCSRIDAVVGAPAIAMRATLWGPNQERVAAGSGGERATLFACVPAAGSWTLDIEGAGRPAAFAVESRKEKAAPGGLLQNPLAAGRLLARASGDGMPFDLRLVTRLREVTVDQSKRVVLDVTVPAGVCEDVVVGLGAGANGVTVRLTDGGRQIGAGTGSQAVAVRVCAEGSPRSLKAYVSVDAGAAGALVAEVPAQR